MALQILDVDGDRVYVGGYVDLKFVDPHTLEISGLDVDNNDSYEIAADESAAQQWPGFAAGKILRMVCNVIKEALCNNCP